MIQRKDIIIALYENESKNLVIKLDKTERIIECFEKSLNIDITVVEIIPKDSIKDNINKIIIRGNKYKNQVAIIVNNNETQVKLSKPYQMKLDFEEYV